MLEKKQARPQADAIEQIEAYIRKNALQPNDRLPGEREMCEMWNVSRTTLRSAIHRMTEEGKLYSQKGSGTYVAQPRMERNLRDMKSTSEQIRGTGHISGTRVLYADVIECTRYLSHKLHLPLGHKLFFLKRLRLMDGAPYMLELSYVDYDCCPGIENISFHEESLYAELKRFGVQMAEGHETIGITYATEEESQYLQVDEETYLFYLTSTSVDTDGKIFEFSKSVARPDKVRFTNTLHRRADPEQKGSNEL